MASTPFILHAEHAQKAQRRQLGICLQWLLDYQKINIEATTSNSRTVLHIVANTMDCDDLWPVLLLLARGADPLVRTNAGDRASDYRVHAIKK